MILSGNTKIPDKVRLTETTPLKNDTASPNNAVQVPPSEPPGGITMYDHNSRSEGWRRKKKGDQRLAIGNPVAFPVYSARGYSTDELTRKEALEEILVYRDLARWSGVSRIDARRHKKQFQEAICSGDTFKWVLTWDDQLFMVRSSSALTGANLRASYPDWYKKKVDAGRFPGEIPHSFAAEGSPVRAGGMVKVKRNSRGILVVGINNLTGHYRVSHTTLPYASEKWREALAAIAVVAEVRIIEQGCLRFGDDGTVLDRTAGIQAVQRFEDFSADSD